MLGWSFTAEQEKETGNGFQQVLFNKLFKVGVFQIRKIAVRQFVAVDFAWDFKRLIVQSRLLHLILNFLNNC